MFKFVENRPESKDCTTGYNVELDKFYTVGSFIEEVLWERNRDWGDIRINDGSLFGKIICVYKHGKQMTPCIDTDLASKKVLSVTADGGWSRMDYMIEV